MELISTRITFSLMQKPRVSNIISLVPISYSYIPIDVIAINFILNTLEEDEIQYLRGLPYIY